MINKLLAYARKCNLDLEIFLIKNDEITIEYLNEVMINYKLQDIKEYKLKALIDGAAVTATVLDISNPEEVINILKTARELTDEQDKDSLAKQFDLEDVTRNSVCVDAQTIRINIKEFNKELNKKYPEVFSIRTEFNYEADTFEIYNTDGVILKDYNYHSFYYSDIVLKVGDKNLCCNKFVMAKEADFELFKKKVYEEIENTLKTQNAKSIKTNKYNIILDNKSVYDILNAFALDFHAKNISRKQSVFTDKLNKKIFNEKITIIEDPNNAKLIGTRLFDSEGTKTYYKKIVDKGVFKTELYNKKYAEKDNTQSTGNSFGVRNIFIEPGRFERDELFKLLGNGLYIKNLMGLHSGINHLTGDISIQCEGFLIENGKKTQAINHIILATNIFELFENVNEVGGDLEFFSSNGGAPSLLINNITIAGKEV